jgi:hypothetical protein
MRGRSSRDRSSRTAPRPGWGGGPRFCLSLAHVAGKMKVPACRRGISLGREFVKSRAGKRLSLINGGAINKRGCDNPSFPGYFLVRDDSAIRRQFRAAASNLNYHKNAEADRRSLALRKTCLTSF